MKSSELLSRYGDLVGAPYLQGGTSAASGIDCVGVVAEVLGRMGKHVPEGALRATPAGVPECWQRLRIPPDEVRAGDVVYSHAGCAGPHVAVVVDPRPPTIVATTTSGRGVRFVPLRAVPGVVAVYRLREESAP